MSGTQYPYRYEDAHAHVKVCKQCGAPYGRKYGCSMNRWNKQKYCNRKCVGDSQIGIKNENSRAWKIKVIAYTVGQYLRMNYGKPNKCENDNCKGKSKFFVWSKLKDKPLLKKREYYRMLCKSCNFLYKHHGLKI